MKLLAMYSLHFELCSFVLLFHCTSHENLRNDIYFEDNQAQLIIDAYEAGLFAGEHNNPLYLGFCIVVADPDNPANLSYSFPSVRLGSEQKMDRLIRLKNKGLDEDEWQKSWNKYQQQYIRKRLQAIKYLHEGQSRKEVIVKMGCARESIATWLDMYDEEGLKGLTRLVKRDGK